MYKRPNYWQTIKAVILLPFLLMYFEGKSQEEPELLYGHWNNVYNNTNFINFSKDTFKVGLTNMFSIKESSVIENNGIIHAQFDNEKNNTIYYYHFVDSFLVITTEKPFKDRVDEISIYSKKEKTSITTNSKNKISVDIDCQKSGLYIISLPNLKINETITDSNRNIVLNNKFVESNINVSSSDFVF